MIDDHMEVLEPVLDNNEEPSWLVKKYKKKSLSNERSVNEIIKNDKSLVEEEVFELKPPNLWKCLKCGALIKSNSNKPLECYEDQGGCGRRSVFEQYTKPINPDLWKLPKWKDIPREELDMESRYYETVKLLEKVIVFSTDIEYKIYTLWCFSTWKLESWDTVGFPAFIGIPDSGKSRALRVISELGYRAVKTSGITQVAIPRLTHFYNATLLIDEAHAKLNPRISEGAEFLNFVKDSYKRGSIYGVCDNNDQEKIICYKNFGFKAFAGEKSFNPSLITRSIVFWMEKENPEISKLSYIEDEFSEIRTYLLNYRYKIDNPPDLSNDFILKGRTREIFESIIATGKHIGVPVNDVIKYAQERDIQEEERLKETMQYDILKVIKEAQEHPFSEEEINRILTDTILNEIGQLTGDKKEDNKARQRIGYYLRNMGLATRRTRDGRALFFEDNIERLKRLYKRYKI